MARPPASPTRDGCHLERGSIIADALFTRTRQRVLGLLFRNPGKAFHVNRIVYLTACGKGNVGRELVRLREAGIVRRTSTGNLVRYEADWHSPVALDIEALLMRTTGLANRLREALLPWREWILLAFVYGPACEGDDGADIRMVIVGRAGREELGDLLREAESDLRRPLQYSIVSTETWYRRQRAQFRSRQRGWSTDPRQNQKWIFLL